MGLLRFANFYQCLLRTPCECVCELVAIKATHQFSLNEKGEVNGWVNVGGGRQWRGWQWVAVGHFWGDQVANGDVG